MIHEFPNLSWTLNAFAQAFFFVSETLPLVSETLALEMVEHLVGVRKHDR